MQCSCSSPVLNQLQQDLDRLFGHNSTIFDNMAARSYCNNNIHAASSLPASLHICHACLAIERHRLPPYPFSSDLRPGRNGERYSEETPFPHCQRCDQHTPQAHTMIRAMARASRQRSEDAGAGDGGERLHCIRTKIHTSAKEDTCATPIFAWDTVWSPADKLPLLRRMDSLKPAGEYMGCQCGMELDTTRAFQYLLDIIAQRRGLPAQSSPDDVLLLLLCLFWLSGLSGF